MSERENGMSAMDLIYLPACIRRLVELFKNCILNMISVLTE